MSREKKPEEAKQATGDRARGERGRDVGSE